MSTRKAGKVAKAIKSLVSNPTLKELTSKHSSLMKNIKGPINYSTARGRHIKSIEHQMLASLMNSPKPSKSSNKSHKNHLKGGAKRRRSRTRRS